MKNKTHEIKYEARHAYSDGVYMLPISLANRSDGAVLALNSGSLDFISCFSSSLSAKLSSSLSVLYIMQHNLLTKFQMKIKTRRRRRSFT